MIQITERGGWHDIILTIMSHCDQPIAFCNHFYAPKLCFFNLSDIHGWYVFEKTFQLRMSKRLKMQSFGA